MKMGKGKGVERAKPSVEDDPVEEYSAEPRPGDDGFDGFRMVLPENCVEYMLFIVGETTDARLKSLEAVRKAALSLSNDLTKDYIWQHDAFKLESKVDAGKLCPVCSFVWAFAFGVRRRDTARGRKEEKTRKLTIFVSHRPHLSAWSDKLR